MQFARGKLARRAAVAMAVAGLAVGMTSGTASADGTNGIYKLCSRGTFMSYIKYGVEGQPPGSATIGAESTVALPGTCVPIVMNGSPVDVYMLYDNGGSKNLGRAWWQGNIETKGYKSTASWGFFA
ncbi:hypothetical protein ABTZ58_35460 [Streptomyces sp. NPDC094143]|uniref:hypothetical protein n=1 Tax=Streptomyces sp. NPDC094143 TaxID=3155310 RepID=UPI00332FE9CD